jgi:hypothetical protein
MYRPRYNGTVVLRVARIGGYDTERDIFAVKFMNRGRLYKSKVTLPKRIPWRLVQQRPSYLERIADGTIEVED